jgi:nickel-dependent lactate racemase
LTGGLKGVDFKDYQALKATAENNHEWCEIANLATAKTSKAESLVNSLIQENREIIGILQKHFPQAHKLVTDYLAEQRKKQQRNDTPPQTLSFDEIQKNINATKTQPNATVDVQ